MLLISPHQGSHVWSSTFLNYEWKHEAFPSADSGVLKSRSRRCSSSTLTPAGHQSHTRFELISNGENVLDYFLDMNASKYRCSVLVSRNLRNDFHITTERHSSRWDLGSSAASSRPTTFPPLFSPSFD